MDIINCIIKFDDAETLSKKGEYFAIIQRDLRNLLDINSHQREVLSVENKKDKKKICPECKGSGEWYNGTFQWCRSNV